MEGEQDKERWNLSKAWGKEEAFFLQGTSGPYV